MKRPGTAGLLILLAFTVVFAVEFHTVLKMLGVDVASRVYFPVAAVIIVAAFALLFLLSEGNGKQPTTA